MSNFIPVRGTTLGEYSAKIEIGEGGFFTISQESPGVGKVVIHYSSAVSFVEDVLRAAKQAEAAYKLQVK